MFSQAAAKMSLLFCSWRTAASSVPPTQRTSGRVWCLMETEWRQAISPMDSLPCRTPRNLDFSSERMMAECQRRREEKVEKRLRKDFALVLLWEPTRKDVLYLSRILVLLAARSLNVSFSCLDKISALCCQSGVSWLLEHEPDRSVALWPVYTPERHSARPLTLLNRALFIWCSDKLKKNEEFLFCWITKTVQQR